MSDVSSTSSTYTGMSGAGGGNMIRLTGMSTGLDVDGIVKKMMAAEQVKVDKVKQQQQTIKWKQEAYQGIIKDVKDLQSSFFDVTSSSKNILSSSNFTPYSVSGVGTSAVDTSVATFTPGIGAKTGTYKIHVDQVATGSGLTNNISAAGSPALLTTKLTDINASLTGNISLVLNANDAANNITVTLNNTGDATLGDLINAINNQGSGSVKASYSELTGGFSLNTSKTGTNTSLTIKSGTTNAISSILGTYTADSEIQNGKNADVTITPPGGGAVQVTSKTSNSFIIDGMNYNLSSTGDAQVSVGMDTQKVFDKIKSFIDKYNTVVDEIQTKLTEKKDYSYSPLTDAQKSQMKDSDVTAWEAKAKAGILRNDNNLQTMLTNLTQAFTTAVSNTGLSIGRYGGNTIGLDTSTDYDKPGHIDITDETALKNAIATNGDQVLKLFTNASTSTDTDTAYKENGIFTRISDIFQKNVGYTNTTLNNAILTSYANKQDDYSTTGGSGTGTLPDQIYQQQILITNMTKTLNDHQEKYYQQYSQLETMMNNLNTQQAQLSSMLGS
ncbi:MAG: flagellar filament capping protein FliD [Bacillota bacterium]|nr:flagellar filament capping protein FliD [Bacillota bacterium]